MRTDTILEENTGKSVLDGEAKNSREMWNRRIWETSLCSVIVESASERKWRTGIWHNVLVSTQTQSSTVQCSVSCRITLPVFSITALQKNDSRLLQTVLLPKKKRSTPHLTRKHKLFVTKTYPERWIGGGGSTNWPARSPDFSCACVSTSTVSQWAQYHNEVQNTKGKSKGKARPRIGHEGPKGE